MSRNKAEHWESMMENSAESLAERDAVAKMEALFSNFRPLDHSVRDKIIASAEQKLEDIKEWRAKYKI